MASVGRSGPLAAAFVFVAVVAVALAALTTAGSAGAAVALLVAGVGAAAVWLHADADAPFGLPNLVTLVRLALAALLAGHVADRSVASPAETLAWGFAAVAAVGLALDGVDGWLARRFGPDTPFGARFDMETDAFAILALSALAVVSGKVGAWALAIGLMRYVFVAAAWVWPWLAGPLPPSVRRKAVCVLQGAVLILLALPPVGPGPGAPLAAAALLALAWSFAVDVRHLARSRSR
ncbi:CDP-alcohol phosphatidyltransferase family protein [Chthonobacter rhizosphaerae]|uniref:CDP-alcohol phosphatidyltransferase family protein n=1 Tax=Chthonobacter rhizosphaerae TaxID=2735553 RepID=UPI0015EE9BF3|nr:CDP-alcohol phosphatidyltransferase family protein [Chthonobacter rhizosphaerae]